MFSSIFYFLEGDKDAEELAIEYVDKSLQHLFYFNVCLRGVAVWNGKDLSFAFLLVAVNLLNILLDIIFVKFLYLGIAVSLMQR